MEFIEISLKTKNLTSEHAKKIEAGRFHHWSRIVLLETDTHKAILIMNLFERAIDLIVKTLSLGYFNYARFFLEIEIARGEASSAAVSLGTDLSPLPVRIGASNLSGLTQEESEVPLVKVARVPPSEKPSYSTYLREQTYSSFEEYQKEREALKEPVDLIIGRGTRVTKDTPELNKSRKVRGVEKCYHPFTIDRSREERPDLCCSILAEKLPGILDNSVDEIYLERVYPCLWTDMRLYYNAFRALKVEGELVIDWNDGKKSEAHIRAMIEQINHSFERLGFYLYAQSAQPNSYLRNDLQGFAKFVCVKLSDEGLKDLSPVQLQRETNLLEREIIKLDERFSCRSLWCCGV